MPQSNSWQEYDVSWIQYAGQMGLTLMFVHVRYNLKSPLNVGHEAPFRRVGTTVELSEDTLTSCSLNSISHDLPGKQMQQILSQGNVRQTS